MYAQEQPGPTQNSECLCVFPVMAELPHPPLFGNPTFGPPDPKPQLCQLHL